MPEPKEAVTNLCECEPESGLEIEPPQELLAPSALAELLPADFPLPVLIKFVPDIGLKAAADEATRDAMSIDVQQEGGLQRADASLIVLREALKAIEAAFADPTRLADQLHKRLTAMKGDWCAEGAAAVKLVGRRIYVEQQRLEMLAAEARRKVQMEADRQARERLRLQAEEAAWHQVSARIVEALRQRAQTATAPPVQTTGPAPLRGSSVVKTWSARLQGTPADAEPNPEMAELTEPQQAAVRVLMLAVMQGNAPLTAFRLDWGVLNARAKADKSTFNIPGLEAFEDGGLRAKGRR